MHQFGYLQSGRSYPKAKSLLPTVKASNLEVIAAHVKVARKLATQSRSLPLSQVWETYSNHPGRALPATVREQLSYKATLSEFLRSIDGQISQFSQITEEHVIKLADYLRTTQISEADSGYFEAQILMIGCSVSMQFRFDRIPDHRKGFVDLDVQLFL